MPSRPHLRAADGQAAVELVALLPLLAVVTLVLWQAVVAGHAMWTAGAAARSAARAAAVGGDERAAERVARRVLPGGAVRGLRLRLDEGGEVRLTVRVPAVLGGGSVGSWTATARMEPQQ